MRKRPARTVIEFAVARGGLVKGSRVTKFVMQWTVASQMIGAPITLEEYADWWDVPHSTAYRHQKEFRELFPELATPQPIANRAIAKRREKVATDGVKGVGSIDVTSLVA